MRQLCTVVRRILRMVVSLLAVLALLSAAACETGAGHGEEAFATLVPVSFNLGLRLELMEVRDASSHTPTIVLLIENHSDEQVWFLAPRYGVRAFTYSASSAQWIELEDRWRSTSESEDILVPKGEGPNWVAVVSVHPSTPAGSADEAVRVVVTGEVYRDDQRTGEQVGAYLDVSLKK